MESNTHQLRSIIIDDEPYGRKTLRTLVTEYCQGVNVIGEAGSVDEGCKVVENADLVFLDVEMADGTGFDLLKQVSSIEFEVIFVTAYDTYGIQAVKASAVDYLLKPVDITELRSAVKSAVERYTIRSNSAKLKKQTLESELLFQSKRLTLPSMEGFTLVDIESIVRCQSHKNYTEFFLTEGESILVSKSMGEYEPVLTRFGFFRVHNSHIVNLSHVKKYKRGKGGLIVMSYGKEIPVSVRRKVALLERLMVL